MGNSLTHFLSAIHMLVGMCIYNKEMSWFRNMITNLYNAFSAPVAATRDALSECLQSVHDTASLLYNRTMHYIGETLKNIVENAAEKEKGKRVKVFRFTRSMNRDNTKIIMDKITQHIEMRTKVVYCLKQKFIEKQGRL